MLTQLAVLSVMSVAGWFARRWMKTEFARVDSEIKRAERMLERLRGGRAPQLQFDPVTGHYHPVER